MGKIRIQAYISQICRENSQEIRRIERKLYRTFKIKPEGVSMNPFDIWYHRNPRLQIGIKKSLQANNKKPKAKPGTIRKRSNPIQARKTTGKTTSPNTP